MPGYLLDNNHVQALFDEKQNVMARVRTVEKSQLRCCVITLGEVEAGHKMTKTTNQKRRDEYTEFINREFLPNVIKVSENTRLYYADIIGSIWLAHPPPPGRSTERHLVDLGVDVNDVWTAAVALEHGLVFVTHDRMPCIREATEDRLTFESWI